MLRVVDTNVAIVANGRNTNASAACRLAAIQYLADLLEKGRVVLDLAGEIQAEYHTYLNPGGQPGIGDLFYQTVLNSAPQRVERIELLKDPTSGEFLDFPDDPALAGFDPNDRKFAAAAKKATAVVANATDADWLVFKTALEASGIEVEFVCGCSRNTWHDAP